MIERAITQHVVTGRDGAYMERYERPRPVQDIAKRMLAWRQSPEGCGCGQANAVAFRDGRPMCPTCLSLSERRRDGFDVTSRRGPVREMDDSPALLRGYAIVFNKPSVDLGGFREEIAPIAIERTFTEAIDVRALADHDASKVLGRVSAGTLRIHADKFGLRNWIDPPKASGSVVESVERRDITGQSFGFSVIDDDWRLRDEMPFRTVLDMRVMEVSVVAFPAYPQTSIEIGAFDRKRSVAWLERELRLKRAM